MQRTTHSLRGTENSAIEAPQAHFVGTAGLAELVGVTALGAVAFGVRVRVPCPVPPQAFPLGLLCVNPQAFSEPPDAVSQGVDAVVTPQAPAVLRDARQLVHQAVLLLPLVALAGVGVGLDCPGIHDQAMLIQ